VQKLGESLVINNRVAALPLILGVTATVLAPPARASDVVTYMCGAAGQH